MDGDRSLIQRYRQRALEIRQLLQGMPASEELDLLLKMAADYDQLAASERILDQANRTHTRIA